MQRMSGQKSGIARWAGRTAAGALALAGTLMLAQPARAQFFWNSQPRLSADDVARVVMRRGYSPVRQPLLNDRVYVADVFDRRGRRERLIVTADSGEIVQRFFLDNERFRREADLSIPRGPVPPGRIPEPPRERSLFSRLFGDDHDAAAARPDDDDDDRLVPTPLEPRPRPRRLPRTVERTPDVVRPLAPVESAPLAPVRPPASRPPAAAPATPSASIPPAAATAPAVPERPGRPIARDPLAIPGSRDEDRKAAATAAPPKPATPPPAPRDVPVAPLE